MTMFVVIAALLVLLGVAALTPAILRRPVELHEESGIQQDNVVIAKERLGELQSELERGDIDQPTFELARQELEQGLLQDIGDAEDQAGRLAVGYGRSAWVALALLVPLLAFGLYRGLGAPEYLDVVGPGQPQQAVAQKETPSMAELVVMLEKKLQQSPEDAEGWFMLGRTQASLGEYDKAAVSLEKAVTLSDNHPSAQIALADVLAVLQQGEIKGRALELVNAVLVQQPDNLTALWMAGKAARQRGDYQQAIDYWQQVMPALGGEPELLAELHGLIEDTRQQAAQAGVAVSAPGLVAQTPAATGAGVSLQITIAPALAEKIPGDAILFVFAKRVQGPPMPVAAIRRSAAELPLQVVMNDSHMLTPGGRMSDFKQLLIGARISMSGQPMAQSGDLQSKEQLIVPGDSPVVDLLIDEVVSR